MNFPICVAIAPPAEAAPLVEVVPDGFDALAGCRVVFSPAGQTALALISLRKRLAGRYGRNGHLSARDRKNLERHCKRLGFNEAWTAFVLGVQ